MADRGLIRLPWNPASLMDPELAWWEFNGTDAQLRLSGLDPSAEDFDPHLNTEDFTIMGKVHPDTVSPMLQGIFTKGNVPLSANCWGAYIYYNTFVFGVSKDGLDSGAGVTTVAVGISAGNDYFFAGKYNYISDGASEISLVVNTGSDSDSAAVGPVFSDTDADVQIGEVDHSVDTYFEGDIFWLAYWNTAVSDSDIDDVRTGVKKPWEISGCKYWGATKRINNIYTWELGEYAFGVEGSPIKRGKPPFTGLEDIPRLTSTPKEYNLPYSLVRDCGLVQVPNEALMGLTPALLKQLNVQPQPDSVVIETKSGRRLVGYANIQRQIDKG